MKFFELCLTDTFVTLLLLYQHNGMDYIQITAGQANTVNAHKNLQIKLMKCCANIYFNKNSCGIPCVLTFRIH
jgi:hypothetical protein